MPLPARGRTPAVSTVLAAALVVAAVLLAGCSRAEFADRSAVITIDGRTDDYAVTTCGLDGRTLFVVARADDGAIAQLVVGLAADLATGIPASTGLSVDRGPATDTSRVEAFGAEAWTRRGQDGSPPGEIRSARLRGSRIQVTGDLVPVDAQEVAVPRAAPLSFSFDARCDQRDP